MLHNDIYRDYQEFRRKRYMLGAAPHTMTEAHEKSQPIPPRIDELFDIVVSMSQTAFDVLCETYAYNTSIAGLFCPMRRTVFDCRIVIHRDAPENPPYTFLLQIK
jgi:hypothetical protein